MPPFYIRGFMAVYDFRKAQKGVSGQKTVSLGANNNDLEKRVSGLEDKLDTILTLLNKNVACTFDDGFSLKRLTT